LKSKNYLKLTIHQKGPSLKSNEYVPIPLSMYGSLKGTATLAKKSPSTPAAKTRKVSSVTKAAKPKSAKKATPTPKKVSAKKATPAKRAKRVAKK
jgi:hypothetical protein